MGQAMDHYEEITIQDPSVDILVVDKLPIYAQKRAILRPVRVSNTGDLCVLFQNDAYPLFLNANRDLCILLTGAKFRTKNTQIPPEFPIKTNLRFIEPPLDYELSNELKWSLNRNQFGVYIYLSAPDELVELFVSFLIDEKKLNILSWGENYDTEKNREFDWRIKLSAGLSIDTVKQALLSVLAITNVQQFGTDNHSIKNVISQSTADTSNKDELNKQRILLDKKDQEVEFLHDKINALNSEVAVLSAELEAMKISKSAKDLTKKKRSSEADRLISNILFALFPSLAFSPDSVQELVSRFANSSAIWENLRRLNSGEPLPMEKLNGLAGKTGWLELRKHINTGDDKRGRIYCRKSSRSHSFDVVVHWKKDDKDQQRTFTRMARLEPFETTRTVFM